jgi:hypothetical protein
VALRRCDVLSVTHLVMSPLVAVPLITGPLIAGLLTLAPVIAVPLITDLLITAMLRSVRSMGFAYELPDLKTGIVRNFSPTFTSFKSRDHLSEAVARGFGQ